MATAGKAAAATTTPASSPQTSRPAPLESRLRSRLRIQVTDTGYATAHYRPRPGGRVVVVLDAHSHGCLPAPVSPTLASGFSPTRRPAGGDLGTRPRMWGVC